MPAEIQKTMEADVKPKKINARHVRHPRLTILEIVGATRYLEANFKKFDGMSLKEIQGELAAWRNRSGDKIVFVGEQGYKGVSLGTAKESANAVGLSFDKPEPPPVIVASLLSGLSEVLLQLCVLVDYFAAKSVPLHGPILRGSKPHNKLQLLVEQAASLEAASRKVADEPLAEVDGHDKKAVMAEYANLSAATHPPRGRGLDEEPRNKRSVRRTSSHPGQPSLFPPVSS